MITRKSSSRSSMASAAKSGLSNLPLNLRLLYLFTASDLKTIAFPSSLFGILGSACKQVVLPATTLLSLDCVARWPIVFFWVWVNLLPFNINNQSAPGAVDEDMINKGWRPLPSGMISIRQARFLMAAWYAIAIITSWILGPLPQCLSLICLGYWYNLYGGADVNWVVRNGINALGYMCFVTGATTVAAKGPEWTPLGFTWLSCIALIIFTTVQLQDLEDQRGDAARGRKTMPLQIGDLMCRIVSSAAVSFWSIWVIYFWELNFSCWVHILLGATVAMRCLRYRSVESDKLTFRIWNLWIISVYAAPLLSAS